MEQQNSLVEYGSRRVIITITAVFCALLEIIDTTIVNVALPNMRGSLGATLSEVSWVITAYHCQCNYRTYDELAVATVWQEKLLRSIGDPFHDSVFPLRQFIQH